MRRLSQGCIRLAVNLVVIPSFALHATLPQTVAGSSQQGEGKKQRELARLQRPFSHHRGQLARRVQYREEKEVWREILLMLPVVIIIIIIKLLPWGDKVRRWQQESQRG